MILTYRYRIKDGKTADRRALRAQARAVNFVWNHCCEIDRQAADRYRAGMNVKRPSGYDLGKLCAGTSRDIGLSASAIDEVCAKFEKARRACFPKTPRFRSAKRSLDWIPCKTFKTTARLDGNILTFYGRKYRLWLSRPIPDAADLRSWNLACDSDGHWFFNVQVQISEGEPRGGPEVGVDLGLKSFVSTSDGTQIMPPQLYRRAQQTLAMHQRRGQKARTKKLRAKIGRQRRHFLHVESTKLVRQYGRIVVGDVSPSKLMKTRMAKSVSDAGWAMFKDMLRYKAIAHGVQFSIVNEAFSSVTCSACGSRSGPKGQKGLRVREWVCGHCGSIHDRDVNAARNILGWEHPPRVAGRRSAPERRKPRVLPWSSFLAFPHRDFHLQIR